MHNHDFQPISGGLRDRPTVGLKKCRSCGLVNHSVELQHLIDYSAGTMHEWDAGLPAGSKPSNDINRRGLALMSMMGDSSGKKHIDVGCGDASLVELLRNSGVDSYGLDPDQASSERARGSGLTVFPSLGDVPAGLKFDLVSLFHVVEHFDDVVLGLQSIKSLLKPDALVVIETPNADDALLTLFESKKYSEFTFWSHHPNVCTSAFIAEALGDAGYTVVRNEQFQRYGLANHLYWLSRGEPGGHVKWKEVLGQNAVLDREYERVLRNLGLCDTLWVIAKMTEN